MVISPKVYVVLKVVPKAYSCFTLPLTICCPFKLKKSSYRLLYATFRLSFVHSSATYDGILSPGIPGMELHWVKQLILPPKGKKSLYYLNLSMHLLMLENQLQEVSALILLLQL